MAYNPRQPRDIIGRWRLTSLARGRYEVKSRSGRIYHYFVNNPEALQVGSTLLGVATDGDQMSSIKDNTPEQRVHLLDNGQGNLMAVSTSADGCTMITDMNQFAPDVPLSVTKGNRFQPVSQYADGEHKEFGGRSARQADRNDGKTYDTMNVHNALTEINNAFGDENIIAGNAHCEVPTEQIAQQAIQARKAYMEMEYMGDDGVKRKLTEGQARNLPVMTYFDEDGFHAEPALVANSNGDFEYAFPQDMGNLAREHGSGVSVMRGSRLTRIARGLQAEGFERVDMAVSEGTQVNVAGVHNRNALHFTGYRTDPSNGHEYKVQGTIEEHGKGGVRARAYNYSPDKRIERREQDIHAEYKRRGIERGNPKNNVEMASVYNIEHGYSVSPDNVRKYDKREGTWEITNADTGNRMLVDNHGTTVGFTHVNTVAGAVYCANTSIMANDSRFRFFSEDNARPRVSFYAGDAEELPADSKHRRGYAGKMWQLHGDGESMFVQQDGTTFIKVVD